MSNVICGKDLKSDVSRAVSQASMIVTDGNVAKLYPEFARGAFVIPAGEKSKTVEVMLSIVAEMQKRMLHRDACVVALGGGVVGDITGFAASVYMRGIEWVNIPTTLLAMVDSSIGGKTAVDFGGVKNLVGAFHEPRSVIISAKFLDTLPDREWLCGTGELIKTCLLTEEAYATLKSELNALNARDSATVFEMIRLCVQIKNAVVAADPHEKNLRKILNVGHTVGHALESLDCYRLSHGEYVLKGMLTELALCKDIVEPEFYREIVPMLSRFVTPPRSTAKAVCDKALSDKKNVGGTVSIMLPVAAGDITEVKIEPRDFIERYNSAVKELKSV